MNIVFLGLVIIAYGVSMAHQLGFGAAFQSDAMQQLSMSMFQGANDAVHLVIDLIGVLALFMGLMQVASQSGLLQQIARLLYPVLKKLFPQVPCGHPAMGAMVMNISANLLGLGNAATPFGIKAMQGLNTLNPSKGVATNAMVLFLAINTSSVTLIPTKVIALRQSAGSVDPGSIISTTLFATLCSTIVAILAAKGLERFFTSSPAHPIDPLPSVHLDTFNSAPLWASLLFILGLFSLIPITLLYGEHFSRWVIPSCFVFIFIHGAIKGTNLYEAFIEGAKEGFTLAIKILPYLVAILVALAMFRQSGALETLIGWIAPMTEPFGLPAQALPMALMRPLSGSGSLGILADLFNHPEIGPDSYVGILASTFMGSTETTFYVLAVYFGSVQIQKIRHAIWAALLADFTAIVAGIFIVHWMFA